MLAAAAHSLYMDKATWDDIGIWGHLPFTVHRCEHLADHGNLAPPGFYTVRCSGGPSCAHCTNGQGGYQFRWFSPLWPKAYVVGARQGAWLPGGSEERWRRTTVPTAPLTLSAHSEVGGTREPGDYTPDHRGVEVCSGTLV